LSKLARANSESKRPTESSTGDISESHLFKFQLPRFHSTEV
jgi:hypothetical protein